MKARIFIGSSKESLPLAWAVQENLNNDGMCTVWNQGVFRLSRGTLETLLSTLGRFDFGVFIFAPDDIAKIRGRSVKIVRDNVLFELGLYMGRLGLERTFFIVPNSNEFRTTTDLAGITAAVYDPSRKDLVAALGTACNQIRREFSEVSASMGPRISPPIKAGFFASFDDDFRELWPNTKKITVYFIHSRRWRETHRDALFEFLDREGTSLTVILADHRNRKLMEDLASHFDDGPHIPGFIREAVEFFQSLRKRYPRKVSLFAYQLYPTYSLYKFDDEIIVAMYPTTASRRAVPTFRWPVEHPFAQFALEDVRILLKTSKPLNISTRRI